jgi:hypothetical protein
VPEATLSTDVDAPVRPTGREPVDARTDPLDHDDLPWAVWMEGLEAKVLRASIQTNEYTLLVRFQPGVELPRHRHFGPVHAWTIQGRWHYLEYDWIASEGTYVHEDALSTHTLKVLDDNEGVTIVLFVIHGGLVLLNDENQPWWYEDAETALTLYRAGVEAAGQELDESRILQ